MAEAEGDLGTARHRMEDAIDLFQQSGAPFETAVARINLARVLAALGRGTAATEQARRAHEALHGMQAQREAQRAGASSANSRKWSPGRLDRCSPLANSTC